MMLKDTVPPTASHPNTSVEAWTSPLVTPQWELVLPQAMINRCWRQPTWAPFLSKTLLRLKKVTQLARASHNSRFRCGRIALAADPPLSAVARALLESEEGGKLFAEQYGDYMVVGYVLGADVGACLAASNSSKRDAATITTTVNVQVLWSDFADSTSKTDIRQTCSMNLALYGYDSLGGTSHSLCAESGKPTEHIREAALEYVAKTHSLQQRLNDRIRRLGIKNGRQTNIQQCSDAIDAGVVVELILVPFKTLKEYVECLYGGPRNRAIKATIDASKKWRSVYNGFGRVGYRIPYAALSIIRITQRQRAEGGPRPKQGLDTTRLAWNLPAAGKARRETTLIDSTVFLENKYYIINSSTATINDKTFHLHWENLAPSRLSRMW